jgi:hypothetical protein
MLAASQVQHASQQQYLQLSLESSTQQALLIVTAYTNHITCCS